MFRRLCAAGIFLSFICSFTALYAQEKPVDMFIARLKETNKFTSVSNVWAADNNYDQSVLLQSVERVQPLLIDYGRIASLMQQRNTAISLSIPGIGSGSYTLELGRYDYFSNDFQVHAAGADNVTGNYTPGLYYSGVVKGIPGSLAAFSFFDGEVYGIFSIPGEGNYTLVPNTAAGTYYDHNPHYVLYNDLDLKIKVYAPGCAADKLPDISSLGGGKTTTTLNNNVYNSCTEVRVYEVADYATYLSKGSSVTNVTNYMTALFNNQATIYRNEGILISLHYLQINTTSDEYQAITSANSSLFLDKFAQVTMNALHGADLALLFSTRYGTMGGIAWIKAMCTSYNPTYFAGPYGFCNIDNAAVVNFPTFSWDVEVATHEMGHIVGSPHTHRCCWNPPGTGTTAIDGCYTIEGTCPDPGLPAGGGTIMSYCHLTSVGINFSRGFGPQPGDTIRYFINHSFSGTCGAHYNPYVALAGANRTLNANRECTDLSTGYTYYWADNNTASQTDDTLVLMIAKGTNTIGNLNSAGFGVSATTLPGEGSGLGQPLTFPSGTSLVAGANVAMRRYWSITGASAAASPVEVVFPFMAKDTSDINGTVPGNISLASLKMYKVNSPVDPNPAASLAGASTGAVTIYTYGTAPTTSTWSLTTIGGTYLAHMKMTNLSGGGSGFYTYASTTALEDLQNTAGGVYVYPSPTRDIWYIAASPNNGRDLRLRMFTIDGKLLLDRLVPAESLTGIDLGAFPVGVYIYRIVTETGVYTGSVQKN